MAQDEFNSLNDNGASGEGDGRYDRIEEALSVFDSEIGHATEMRDTLFDELAVFFATATLKDMQHLEKFMLKIERDLCEDEAPALTDDSDLRGQDTKLAKRLVRDIASHKDALEMAAPAEGANPEL